MFDDDFMNDMLLNPDLYGLEDDKKKLKMMKSSELRVYKDNSRPVVFDDKRFKEKHKKRLINITD